MEGLRKGGWERDLAGVMEEIGTENDMSLFIFPGITDVTGTWCGMLELCITVMKCS